jgi:hypothetical protein
MKKCQRKKLHLISTAGGRLHNFLLLKIPKGNMKAGRFYILSEKMIFFRIFEFHILFLQLFNHFEAFILFWNFGIFYFFLFFLNFLSIIINNRIMLAYYLEFIDAYYYLIIVAYF